MTLKLIDLFETKFIGGQNIEDKKIFEKLNVHSLLNLDSKIREQFLLIISTFHKNLFVVNVFKKHYNEGDWSNLRGQYLNSFCLSSLVDNEYDWKNLEDKDFLENNEIDEEYFIIDDSYNHSILSDDYNLYISLKSRYFHLTKDFDRDICQKAWGRTYHFDNINWQIILFNLLIGLYGSGINEINFRSKTFEKKNVMNLYFPNFDGESIIYKNYSENRLGVCDNCDDTIGLNYDMWHNPKYGDLCQYCFKEKESRENYRHLFIKRYIRSIGKRIIFKIDLEKTKKRLEEIGSIELDDKSKYNLMKKINKNMLESKDRKVMECCVCLEEMRSDIYAGSCGHCLHDICYFKLNSNQCPLCRKVTYFKKLHL